MGIPPGSHSKSLIVGTEHGTAIQGQQIVQAILIAGLHKVFLIAGAFNMAAPGGNVIFRHPRLQHIGYRGIRHQVGGYRAVGFPDSDIEIRPAAGEL